MHYLTYVFIEKDTNIDSAVPCALAPFSEDRKVEPWKAHLEPGEIGAMARSFSIRRNQVRRLAEKIPEWNGCSGGVDEQALYALCTHNPNAKFDWYEIGGRWTHLLPGNVITAGALRRSRRLEELLPHDFLTPDGTWHGRARYIRTGWLEGRFIRKPPRR